MNKVRELTNKIDELSLKLICNLLNKEFIRDTYDHSPIRNSKTPSMPYPHDIYKFAEKIIDVSTDIEVQNSANALMLSINDAVIRPRKGGNDYTNPILNGVSIYFPPKLQSYIFYNYDDYKDLDFCQNTNWDEFLEKCYPPERAKGFSFLQLFSSKILHLFDWFF